MKAVNTIIKILTALAAVAGVVYLLATYGDKIVAWAKKLLSCSCCCGDEECCCGSDACCCDEEACCCEEAPVEDACCCTEETSVEAAANEEAPAAEEGDFA